MFELIWVNHITHTLILNIITSYIPVFSMLLHPTYSKIRSLFGLAVLISHIHIHKCSRGYLSKIWFFHLEKMWKQIFPINCTYDSCKARKLCCKEGEVSLCVKARSRVLWHSAMESYSPLLVISKQVRYQEPFNKRLRIYELQEKFHNHFFEPIPWPMKFTT